MEVKLDIKLQSPAFRDGERIPDKFTCNGENISPPLSWSRGPEGTGSWALIMEDPDSPRKVFTHWLIYNIPAGMTGLPEALPTGQKLDSGVLQGKNDTLKSGYTGPCPPPGPMHHYIFNLYALDAALTLPGGVDKEQLLEAINGHVLARGKLTGVYQSSQSP